MAMSNKEKYESDIEGVLHEEGNKDEKKQRYFDKPVGRRLMESLG